MDDLEALEAAISMPSSASAGRASSSAGSSTGVSCLGGGGGVEQPEGSTWNTPQKRRRKGVDSPFVKTETLDENSPAAGSLVECLQSPDIKREDDPACGKDCQGCGRNSHTGRDFLNPTAPVNWAFTGGRGMWCRECFNLWRTVWSDDGGPLLFFPKWLSTRSNMERFEYSLVAYLSLLAEGVAKVTCTMVLERMSTLRFSSRLLGLTPQPMRVVMLDDYMEKMRRPGDPFDPNTLVTVVGGGGKFRLGVLVPDDPAEHAGRIERPLPPGCGRLLGSRASLACDDEQDIARLKEVMGSGITFKVEDPQIDGQAQQPLGASKLEGRLISCKLSAQVVLRKFGEASWETVKEATFTPLLSKFMSLHSEASTLGDGIVLGQAESYRDGLQHGKNFCKGYREYQRARFRHQQLVDMGPRLAGFVSFAQAQSMTIHPTLELLCAKIACFEAAEKQSSQPATAGLQAMIDKDVGGLLLQVESQRKSPGQSATIEAAVWLRAPLQKLLCDSLEKQGAADPEASVAALHADVKSASALVAKLGRQVRLEDVHSDVRSYLVVLGAACDPGGIEADKLQEAVGHLEHSRLRELKQVLDKSAIGQHVLALSSSVLQASAQDTCGDEKLKLAMNRLSDRRLPAVTMSEDGSGNACIVNFEILSEMGIADLLSESVELVQEAMQLWSPVHSSGQATTIKKWWEALMRSLTLYDESLSAFLQGFAQEHIGEFINNTERTCEIEPEVEALPTLSAGVSQYLIDESPFHRFLTNLKTFMEDLPAGIAKVVRSSDARKELLSTILNNIRTRELVWSTLDGIAGFAGSEFPKTSGECIEEWKAKLMQGTHGTSFLAKGMDMMKRRGELSGRELSLEREGGDLTVCFKERDEDSRNFTGRFNAAPEMPTAIFRLAIIDHIEELVSQSLQQVLDDFGSSLFLSALKPDAAWDAIDSEERRLADIPALVVSLYDKSSLPDGLKIASKIYSTGKAGKREMEWPCESALTLLMQLVDVMPSNTPKNISVLPLCSANAKDAGTPLWVDDARCLLPLCEAYRDTAKINLTVAYLESRFMQPGETATRDRKLKGEVEAAIRFVRTATHSLRAKVLQKSFGSGDWAEGMPLQLPLKSLLKWTEKVEDTLPLLSMYFFDKMVQEVTRAAGELQKGTPQYDHICSDEHVHAGLAKKHLLQCPSRAGLGEKCVHLHNLLVEASRLHSEWGMQPAPGQPGCFWQEEISSASSIFEAAKKTMAVIAAISAVQETTGADRVAATATLLRAKKDVLPKSLVRELQKHANQD